MSSTPGPSPRGASIGGFSICVAAVVGIAVGWLATPDAANARVDLHCVAGPACFGAMCVYALRGGGRAALSWLPLLLPAVFLLEIAGRPQIPVLSASSMVAAASFGIASWRGYLRTAVASAVVSCALLVATLIGGQLIR